jgi:hypothetical protein
MSRRFGLTVGVCPNGCTLALQVGRLAARILTLPLLQEMFVLPDPVLDSRPKLIGGPLVTDENCRMGIELLACPMRPVDRSRQVSAPREGCGLLE